MAFAILRTAKLSTFGSIQSSGQHTYRQKGLAPNADPQKTLLNRTIIGTPLDVLSDVKQRISEVTDNPRKNAVLAIEYLLTASPEFFQNKSKSEIKKWSDQSITWLKQKHGKNLVHACLHLDETTPHIVAYVVPEANGSLNCRSILGGREKLEEIQTSYANSMKEFGLERGIKGSKAEHQRVKTYYTKLNSMADAADQQIEYLGKPVTPPKPRLLSSRKAQESELGAWMGQEVKRTEKLVQKAAGAFLAAREAREEVVMLKAANGDLSVENDRLKQDLQKAYESLGLDNDRKTRLRKTDISLVAQLLGYMGEVKPKENALDLVMRIGQFNFAQAVAWLHNEIGSEQAGIAVEEAVIVAKPDRPFTPAENEIKRAVIEQTEALGCDKYRLTLLSKFDDVKPFLPGKTPGKEVEKFYTKQELVHLIPWLRFKNNEGNHILVTPMDDHAFYVLLDDAKVSYDQLKKAGFAPCLVQKSSWNSEQIVFKVPRELNRKHVISFFNQFNRELGDEKISALRHAFRLAGFRNLKPKHEREGQFPFVKVIEAVNRFCMKSVELIQRFSESKAPLLREQSDHFPLIR